MKTSVKCAGCFLIGGIVGSVVTYFVSKKKFEKEAHEYVDQQIEEMRQYYRKKNKPVEKKETVEVKEEVDTGIDESVRSTFPSVGYDVPAERGDTQKKTVCDRPEGLPPTAVDTPDGYPDYQDATVPPYLIREEDFGEVFDDICEWVFWKDGYLTTDDFMAEKVDIALQRKMLPINWQNDFGWGEDHKYDNIIYFRNNREKTDIQIVRSANNYVEWMREHYPNMLDDEDM